MKVYPKIYSRDSHGKIRVWWMEQDDNKYRTISGTQDGEKVTTNWTIVEGKNVGRSNQTSDIEQAEKEVSAKYKDQLSTGYFEDIAKVDEKLYFEPMLAFKYENYADKIDWSKGNYVSEKMDGLRCILTKNGSTSRNGKKLVSFPHILESLRGLFEKCPYLVLDGEIYCDRLSDNFNKIISLAKKTKPTLEDLEESKQYIQFWVFDAPSCPGGFHDRYLFLCDLINKYLPNNKYIKICCHELIDKPEKIEEKLQEYISLGFEGLMLNTFGGKYEQKRSKNLLKYKKFQDCEAEVLDIVEGVGNRSGMFGYAILMLDNGKTFNSNARGDEFLYKQILENKTKYIGKTATIRFQALTPDGIPRFPIIVDFNRLDT